TGGSLAAGDSCTFSLTVDIPVGLEPGTYTNTTEEISAVLDGHAGTPTVVGPPASDDIVVLAAPNLSKEFIDDPVQPGGTVTLEFNLTYAEGTESQATAIAFTDDLSFLLSGITATDIGPSTCNGTIDISTPTMIAYSGGSMSPGEECAFTVTLSVPDSAVSDFYGNTTSEITAMVDGVTVRNNAAEDDLLVTSVLFTKEFLDDPVIAGGEVDLEFRIENLSSTLTASSISFNDSLSAILPGTPDVTAVALPALPASCGASASLTGTSTLSFSDGEVAPGEVCSFTVTLMVPTGVADDTYINTTSSLSTGLGSLPPAIDELMVNSTLIGLTKEFTDDPVAPGDTTTLEFTLENLSAETITGIKFSDDLDAALSGLEAAAATNDCGGMATSAFPNGLFEFEGGTLAPGATCTISLTINVPDTPLASGPPYINTTSDVTGKVGALDVFGAAASDELVINTLVLAKEFDAATGPGGTAVLTFTLENLSATDTADNLAFTDDLDAVIAGLEATSLPANPVCGGMLSGSSLITLTGASLAPATVCEFDVTVEVPATASEGQFINTTSELRQDSAPVANPAVALLTIVPPPTFSKVFTPDSIVTIGEISTLVFTIDNTANTVEASDLDFSDILTAGTFVASPANAMTTCTGGTLTAAVGSAVISYSGGSVAAGASCTVEVDIDADTAGMLDNTSGELTSSLGNSGTASDTLTVTSNDADSDTIADAVDNCPDDANTDQADQDGDMIGDVCDPDIDGDMIDNGVDNCPVDANADQADLDMDGTGDVCDDDADGDGMPNDFETANGLNPFNSFDQLGDPDGDGFTNLEEFEFGSDPNVFDEDLDGNGIPDSVENNNSFIVPTIILPLILDQ
ncbi:MAG: thrombospondin type 3 repeat-containing protein, partial [Arenicella sp.]|nr:thrombospondin type 3 repeat-containing protein [Arenicella sp.]